jgi:hypothetical protein
VLGLQYVTVRHSVFITASKLLLSLFLFNGQDNPGNARCNAGVSLASVAAATPA